MAMQDFPPKSLKNTTWKAADGMRIFHIDLGGTLHCKGRGGWYMASPSPQFLPVIESDANGPRKLTCRVDDLPHMPDYLRPLAHGTEWQRVELKPHEAIRQGVRILKGYCQEVSTVVDRLSPKNLPSFVCRKKHNCLLIGCYDHTLSHIHSVASTRIAGMAPLIAGINTKCEVIKAADEFKDAYERVHKLEPTMTEAEFYSMTSELNATANTMKLLRPLLKFERDGQTVLCVHANVLADISSVFENIVKVSPGEPICMDKDPWKKCEVNTLKVIVYFAYLGLHQHVTNAVDTMEPSQREALYALVQFLEKEPVGSDLAGKDTPSKLREFKKVVTAAIRKRARELDDDDE